MSLLDNASIHIKHGSVLTKILCTLYDVSWVRLLDFIKHWCDAEIAYQITSKTASGTAAQKQTFIWCFISSLSTSNQTQPRMHRNGVMPLNIVAQWCTVCLSDWLNIIRCPETYYTTKLLGGYIGFIPSIRPSVCPSIPHPVSALQCLQFWLDPFHIYTSYQATS